MQHKLIPQRQVAGVPGFHVVIEDVLLFVVTLSGIDERVVQIPALVLQAEDGRSRVPGDIGNLVVVIAVGRIRHVTGILIGILGTGRRYKILTDLEVCLCLHVDALDMHLAQVEHRPTELLTLGIGHNLIVYRIIICVEVHLSMTDDAVGEVLVQGEAHIILRGPFWHKVRIAHIGIVEVVERRHTETLLHVGPQREERASEGIDVHKNCRSQFLK